MSDSVPEKGPDELKLWSCELNALVEPKDKAKPEEWTVGGLKLLSCRGDFIEKSTEPLKIVFPDEKNKYLLKVIKTHSRSEKHADLIVTSYKAAEVKKTSFEVTDGTNSFFVKDLSWTVASVLDKKEKPTAFGPTLPLRMVWPMWAWLGLLLPLIICMILGALKVRKVLARKRLLENLKEHQTALPAYNEFTKDMRKINRKFHSLEYLEREKDSYAKEFLDELNHSFRLYLTRELKIPALEWSSSAIMAEIKLRHKVLFKKQGVLIRRALSEYDQALLSEVSVLDCEQLYGMSHSLAGKIFQQMRSR